MNYKRQDRSNKRFLKVILFFVGFYLIYQPDLLGGQAIVSEVIVLFLLLLECLFLSFSKILEVLRYLSIWCWGVLVSSIFFLFRALLVSEDTRTFQNLIVLVNVFALVMFIEIMKEYFYMSKEDLLRWFIFIAVMQFVIVMIMIVSPELRSAILARTASNVVDNQFIYGERLYGLSSDYTFFTPIYHSILGVTSLYLGLYKNKKYLLFLPVCATLILLNGRTGLITLILGSIVLLLQVAFRGVRSFFQAILISVILIIAVYTMIYLLSIFQPTTYLWIQSGLEDTLSFFQGNKTGNYSKLMGSFLVFPQGIGHWLFGYGFRLYGDNASAHGFMSSDIGYINDLFMGGICYIAILYGGIFGYMIKEYKNMKEYRTLILPYLSILVLANYKGETMRSGLILTSVVVLIYLFATKDGKERLKK